MASEWSALTMITESGTRIIIHNITHSPERQQSNLMHELAHIICKHEMPLIGNLNGKSLPVRHYNEEHEAEAEWLGGNLQITRAGLLWALKRKMSTKEIQAYYTASAEMVTFRINTTGVKRQLNYYR